MLTIFIDEKDHSRLKEGTRKKLESTYTSGGHVIDTVIGHTFQDRPVLNVGEPIEVAGTPYLVSRISNVKFFRHIGESLAPVQQIFLVEEDSHD